MVEHGSCVYVYIFFVSYLYVYVVCLYLIAINPYRVYLRNKYYSIIFYSVLNVHLNGLRFETYVECRQFFKMHLSFYS